MFSIGSESCVGGLLDNHGILELILHIFLINIIKDEIFTRHLIHVSSRLTYEAWLRDATVSRIAITVLYHLVADD